MRRNKLHGVECTPKFSRRFTFHVGKRGIHFTRSPTRRNFFTWITEYGRKTHEIHPESIRVRLYIISSDEDDDDDEEEEEEEEEEKESGNKLEKIVINCCAFNFPRRKMTEPILRRSRTQPVYSSERRYHYDLLRNNYFAYLWSSSDLAIFISYRSIVLEF